MQPVINAGDVVLKRWEPVWADKLTAAVRVTLRELEPFMPWAHSGYDVESARAFLDLAAKDWNNATAFNYAVFAPDGELVGAVGLMTRMGPGTLEIGYWIRTDYTGRGYATQAATALAEVGLSVPGTDRVVIKHDIANPASGAVAARAGFTEIARVEQEPEAPGETGVELVWERRGASDRT